MWNGDRKRWLHYDANPSLARSVTPSSTMARSNARAGPSQPSQTQRTRAGRVRIEEEEEEEEEEINDNEDEEEEEEVAMNVDDDEAGSVRYRILCEKKKVA